MCSAVVTLCAAIVFTGHPLFAGDTSVTVLDVGQGQSVLLRSAGQLVLVDCGGDTPDNPGDIAADYIQSRGRSRLDALVLTHYHDDHANGVLQLLSRLEVENLLLPDVEPENPLRQELLAQVRERKIPVHFVCSDTILELGEDSRITLYPPLDMTHSANEQGLSVLAQMEETSVLVTGDMNARTEQMLLRYAELPDTDVLIAGHHGSDDSTSQALLEKITPDVCIISVGAHNRYGHPGEGALERLTVSGAEIYRTDHSGHVTLTLN